MSKKENTYKDFETAKQRDRYSKELLRKQGSVVTGYNRKSNTFFAFSLKSYQPTRNQLISQLVAMRSTKRKSRKLRM